MTDKFDPTKHLITMRGGRKYLQVNHRVIWFRTEHPKGQIITETISIDPMIIKATIVDNDGNILATAHGSAQPQPNAVWSGREIEKAETAAIGRALGLAGFGTQFTDDFMDESHLADAPTERPQNSARGSQRRETSPQRTNTAKSSENGFADPSSAWWTDNAAIQRIMLETKLSPGKAASIVGKTVREFGSADELIKAYQSREAVANA